MKSITILSIIIIFASLLFPWWITVVASFIYMAISPSNTLWKSIRISFLSGLLSYLIFTIYTSIGVERNPANLIGDLFGELPSWSAYITTALIGGLATAFGGISGHLGSKIIK